MQRVNFFHTLGDTVLLNNFIVAYHDSGVLKNSEVNLEKIGGKDSLKFSVSGNKMISEHILGINHIFYF